MAAETAMEELSLRSYINSAWDIIHPKKKRPLIWNWHLDAICEHLEAVTSQQIHYLLINVPPRHTKSLIVSVFWPTWEWGPQNLPHLRYIYSSYDQGLSTRDALRSRRVIQSPWYQGKWGFCFEITSDQNQKTRYDNDRSGYRIATSVRGIGTGEGGDRIVVDDPHNVRKVESFAMREDTLLWWDESMSSRLDDEKTGAYVIIAQRSHHSDLCGHVIKKAEDGEIDDLVTLILPARFEKERELNLKTKTPLNFVDPRTEEGEPLDHNRFPEEVLDKRERRMTSYSRAGQMQQRPSPRGGGMFPVEMFKIINREPHPNQILKAVRYWDKAGTEGGGSRTAGSLMVRLKPNNSFDIDYLVIDMVKGQWSFGKREMRIKQTAEVDAGRGYEIKTWIEQEPGSGGKDSALLTVQNLPGYVVRIDKVGSSSGNKESRAEPYAAQVEHGRVGLLQGLWNSDFISEHEKAPTGSFKDQWDSSAGAFNKLAIIGKKAGVWGRE